MISGITKQTIRYNIINIMHKSILVKFVMSLILIERAELKHMVNEDFKLGKA